MASARNEGTDTGPKDQETKHQPNIVLLPKPVMSFSTVYVGVYRIVNEVGDVLGSN